MKACRFNPLVGANPCRRSGAVPELPSLIKGYLRIGSLVCGPPALDAEFGTADFFLLLDFVI